MKKLLLLCTVILLTSCSGVEHPDFEKNVATAKQWFEVFVTEDLDATMAFYADEVEYQSAFYGGPLMNREELREYFKGWQDAMEDITWEAEKYLPGVDPETILLQLQHSFQNLSVAHQYKTSTKGLHIIIIVSSLYCF